MKWIAFLPLVLMSVIASQAGAAFVNAAAPVLKIPRPANLHMFAADDARRDGSNNMPFRFAIPYRVNATTMEQGNWEMNGAEYVWRLNISAEGSTSLNIGFSEFYMPRTGRLTIASGNGRTALRPFTAADNRYHGQLWTPVVDGTDLSLEVRVAASERNLVRLRIGNVNYGYRDFEHRDEVANLRASGACNVDVACNRDAGWNDPIRSVAAITVGGTDTCSGSLLNNTNQDRRMFFLTAYHCRIDASNAASVVAIWNYQNSSCRPANSSQSGRIGDGKRSQFSSGASFRAGNAASDFTLVEMNEMMKPEFNLFLSGWDRSGAESPMIMGIHHPSVSEKRISQSTIPSTTTTYLKEEVPGDGTHVRVTRWTSGTTEPGSSGSPLFDSKMRVIGQLHGGYASCSSMTSDWYGRLSASWEGGGQPGTRLKDWLDPKNTGVMAIDGLNGNGSAFH